MKRLYSLALSLTLILAFSISAQVPYITKEFTDQIKSRKLYVVETGYPKFDKAMEEAFKKYWTFNDEVVFAPLAAIPSKAYPVSLISCTQTLVTDYGNGLEKKQEVGHAYKLGFSNEEFAWGIGFSRLSVYEEYDLADVVKRLNFLMFEVEKVGSWNKAWGSTKNSYAAKLKDKVLYIDSRFLKDKLTEDKIAEIYPLKFKVVEFKELEEAVLIVRS